MKAVRIILTEEQALALIDMLDGNATERQEQLAKAIRDHVASDLCTQAQRQVRPC